MILAAIDSGMIEFDAEAHKYRLFPSDGSPSRLCPSVTTILGSVFPPPSWSNEAAMQRGTERHEATEEWDKHGVGINRAALSSDQLVAVELWRDFRETYGFDPVAIEHTICHPVEGYAGRIDRVGTLADGSVCLIDIKSKAVMPRYPLQLAGYTEAWEASGGTKIDAAWCVHLHTTGKPQFVVADHTATLQTAREDWLTICRLYRMRALGLYGLTS